MTTWYDLGSVSESFVGRGLRAQRDRLLDEIAEASPTALGNVYRQHQEAVRRFACRLVGHEEDAEELVQEVFVSLPAAIRGFRADSDLRSFLLGIATNKARHFVRQAARRRAALAGLAAEPTSTVAVPDDALAREQLALRLLRAMDRLPHDQRVAFVLCEVEERTSEDAAAIAGVPSSTLRSRLVRARRELRRLLVEEAR